MTPLDLDEAIERWMRERPMPAAPAGFTAAVVGRVHRQAWESDRYWDLGFNLAVAAGLALVVLGLLAVLYRSGLALVAGDAVRLFAAGLTVSAAEVVPSLAPYAGGVALTMSALGLWWWAESA